MPRCIKPKDFGEPTSFQLHHFSDSSEVGYGTVSYLQTKNSRGEVSVSFMMGKGRVAPLKQITVPRMVLTAADYASRGLSAKKFVDCKQWIQGPMFLTNSENDWPAHDIDLRFNPVDDQEVKRKVVSYTTNVPNKQSPTNQLLSHFSDWLRLKKAVA